MRVVDRFAWIERLIASPTGALVAAELPHPAQWLVPTLVQLERATFLTSEVGEDKADQVIAFTETCLIADLDTAIAQSAATLSARHRRRHHLCHRPSPWRRPANLRPQFRRIARH